MTYSTQDADIYQLALDLRRVDGGERVRSMREKGKYSGTGAGTKIIEEISGRLRRSLDAFLKLRANNYKGSETPRGTIKRLLTAAGKDVCIAITVETTLNAVASSRDSSLYRMRSQIGRNISEHISLKAHAEAHPKFFSRVKDILSRHLKTNRKAAQDLLQEIRDTAPNEFSPKLDEGECMLVGAAMFELLLETATDVFDVAHTVESFGNGRKVNKARVRFTESFLQRMKDIEDAFAAVTPLHLPLTERPIDWTSVHEGGFHSNMVMRRPLMSTRSGDQLTAFTNSHCPEIYKAINTLQGVKWEVNSEVLEVFRDAVEAGWDDENLDISGPTPPGRPQWDEVPERGTRERRIYASEMRQYYEAAEVWDTNRARMGRLLYLSDMYDGKGGHYLVHGIDFRGRIYPTASAMNYQGDDIQRAMCRFHEAKPIMNEEQAEWYLIQGANCWGEDKVPFTDRVKWCWDNKAKIQAVYDDPLDCKWWTEADKPWMFLAWCLEAAPYLADPKPGHMSKLPISMDGSNNGLQIYSLLLRDPVGGAATNCTPVATPADIYQQVADLATWKMEKLAAMEMDEKDQVLARDWLRFTNGRVPRKAAKRLVMTKVYSAGAFSRQRYVSEWYFDEVRGKRMPEQFTGHETYAATWWLAQLMTDCLDEIVSAAPNCQDWLVNLSNIAASHNKHLEWTSPTGMRVIQRYNKSKVRPVQVMCRRKINVNIREFSKDVLKGKSADGFCPNFIHSFDAACATKTINLASERGVTGFMMIHDSYGCHAADAPTMAKTLRDVHIEVFSENWLEKLRDDVISQLPPGTDVPPAPTLGDLDIKELSNATYFFA